MLCVYNVIMVKVSRWTSFIAVFCLFLISSGSAQAQSSDVEYFAETGHYIKGDFLRFYRSAPNPILVFGYPITEQFTSKDGKTVQYFQRARFEQSTGTVVLTPLGQKTYSPERQLVFNNPFACRTFSESGFSVCFAFLEFFEQNGGLARFGTPISSFEFHNDKIVQYFENARFEWHPGLVEGQRVRLTYLGRIYFDQLSEDPGFLKPAPPSAERPLPEILRLQVRAFPAKAVTTPNDQQKIYILVQDQNLQPVASATGTATIRLPSGGLKSEDFMVVDGIGKLDFAFIDQPNGKLVHVNITVQYKGLSDKTTTSFRIWY